MPVGGLEEMKTITGNTPVVDLQKARCEVVLDAEVLATVPAALYVSGTAERKAGNHCRVQRVSASK